jgi:hypothetical protein
MKNICCLFLSVICFFSCDILRTAPFEVTSWSPGEGYHANPDELTVSLNFSLEPDRDSVERRFSLNKDDGRVKGNFNWEGRTVTFVPSPPLEKNRDYNLSLSAEARDKKGLSMDSAFERKFTTRQGTERPVLISFSPSLYAQIEDLKTEVRLSFSLPVTLSALYDNVSFSPSMAGIWRLEEDGRLAVFTPSNPWTNNKRYEMRYSTSLTDNKGMNFGNDFKSVFTTGTDKDNPYLLNAYRVTKDGDVLPLERDMRGFTSAAEDYIENKGWEKEDRLSLVFSRPVDSASVKNCVNVEDASSFSMETAPGFNTGFVFYFENAPVFESRFAVKIKPGVKDSAGNESKDEYVFRILADGESSKPPGLFGIRMPMSPKNNGKLEYFEIEKIFKNINISDEDYPSGVEVKTWIELYFDTAQGATVDLFSVMELFHVESVNGVFTFLPQKIKTENFTITKPQEGWEKYYRAEITGTLKNSIYFGIVNFQINSGLKDSLGNKNEKIFRISTIK